jgi:predicted ABC-type transport system involved in lysophospholipase L1 biosynthesis ATPase subunit
VLLATVRDRRCGLLLITHDPVVAARADRVVELEGGRVRAAA